jgi:hypothetical protein
MGRARRHEKSAPGRVRGYGVTMWLRRKQQRVTEAPSGVRIRHPDGSVSECALMRDPDDQDGCAQWIAVVPEGTVAGAGEHRLEVDYLPAYTGISVMMPVRD